MFVSRAELPLPLWRHNRASSILGTSLPSGFPLLTNSGDWEGFGDGEEGRQKNELKTKKLKIHHQGNPNLPPNPKSSKNKDRRCRLDTRHLAQSGVAH